VATEALLLRDHACETVSILSCNYDQLWTVQATSKITFTFIWFFRKCSALWLQFLALYKYNYLLTYAV